MEKKYPIGDMIKQLLRDAYDLGMLTEAGNVLPTFDQWVASIDHQSATPQGIGWVKADTKPEHNAGVLVFIPGEDNHITSGMWDISNEWVLLDEYRTPEEEVTHWM